MKWSELVVRRPIGVIMVVLVVLLLGTISFTRLGVDLLPDLRLPYAAVITSYPGAGPEEVEKTLTRPLEETLGTVQGVKNVTSMSLTGSSLVALELNYGTDMDFAALDMREKVDMIQSVLPKGAEKPMVLKMDVSMFPIITLAVHGDMSIQRLKDVADTTVKNRLERVEGVASVQVTGGLNREIQVLLSPDRLKLYGLSPLQVVQALGTENATFAAGRVEDAGKQLLIRVTGEFTDLDQVRAVALTTAGGGTVRIADIAQVLDGRKDQTSYALYNGQPALGLSLQKQTDANTVAVSEGVQKALKELEAELPEGVRIEKVTDQADFIRDSINSIYQDILLGSLFAMLVIFIFLRNVRSTLIIGLTIPISVVTTFVLLYFGRMNLNLMTLGGLSLGIGRMVDDAIVVLDNIYRHRRQGMPAAEAAGYGASEVMNAVVASTLTTVAVFLPIAFVEGIASEIFTPMALTVAFALFASLFVALSVTPMLASRLLAGDLPGEIPNPTNVWQRLMSGKWLERLDDFYRQVLNRVLSRRKRTVAAVAVIFVISLALLPLVGMEFIPASDQGRVTVTINLPKGTQLNQTMAVADRVAKIAGSLADTDSMYLEVGSAGGESAWFGGETPEAANLTVNLKPLGQREHSSIEVADTIRKAVATIPGADIKVAAANDLWGMSMGSGAPISVNIHGDDLDVLKDLSAQAKTIVQEVPGAVTVKSSLEEGRPQVEVKVDRNKAAFYGLSVQSIGTTVAAAVQGTVATRYREGGNEYDVRVRLQENDRKTLADLENLTVPSPLGVQVPISEVAELSLGTTPSTISRYNRDRIATISADLDGSRALGPVMQDIQAALEELRLPAGYSVEYAGQNQEMIETFGQLGFALIIAIFLVYMVMAVQYESLLYPFVIMFSIPVSLVGVVGALLLTNRALSITAMIGIIMLTGIVLSNAIVLVDYINTLRRRGMPRREAIITAGATRLKPILMTALVTILAMLPIATALGTGGEFNAPLATAVVGGLIASTVLTLVIVPVLYTVFEDAIDRLRSKFGGRGWSASRREGRQSL